MNFKNSVGGKVVSMNRSVQLNLHETKFNTLLDPSQNASMLNEYRRIKRPILEYAFSPEIKKGPRPNILMVTSSVPEEGKTFTAINMALSIAMELDRTVLLVDGDVVNPSLNRELNLANYPGLNDYLSDSSSDLASFILKTEIDNLNILPAGKRSMRSVELLSSNRMEKLVDELSERYSDRIIVIDSPPILATNEAPLLSSLVGQILVVVKAESTSKSLLKDALGHLKQGKPINLVLNKVKKKTGNYGYGYGYGN